MRIAAYCRVSTDKEEQLHSLAAQKEFFTEYAAKNGHQLTALYADEGITGTSLKKRTEFKRLMADAEQGAFEMVVVKDISRFARNTVDFLQSIRALKAMGINTIFLTANMTSLGDSEFLLTIFGAMAQEESANLSKRVKFGKKQNAKKGRVPQRIYGYDRIDNFTLKIDPTEAGVVRRIYRLYVEEGLGCRRIALELNRAGECAKLGGPWNTRGVRRVLTNPIYCGEYVNNKYEVQDYLTGKLVPLPEAQHLHHERPEWAVVSRELFDRAQQILDQRRKQYSGGAPFREARYSGKHLFSTLIKCGCCGGSYCRKQYTYVNTRVYWKCRINDQQTAGACRNTVKIDEGELIEAVSGYLSSLLPDKTGFIGAAVREALAAAQGDGGGTALAPLEAQRAALEKRRERSQELYVNDVITMEELKAKLRAIDASLAEIARSLRRQSAAGREELLADAAKGYAVEAERFLRLETATNADLRRLIDHILVEPDGTVTVSIKAL